MPCASCRRYLGRRSEKLKVHCSSTHKWRGGPLDISVDIRVSECYLAKYSRILGDSVDIYFDNLDMMERLMDPSLSIECLAPPKTERRR